MHLLRTWRSRPLRRLVFLASLVTVAPLTLSAAEETPPSADSVMTQAEKQAQAEHKNILVSFGASWCGNCHLFDHFLADPAIRPIMTKAFVNTELITGEHPSDTHHANSPGGLEFEKSLGGKDAGWPYIAMLAEHGKLLIDSFRPSKGQSHADNIGYPASPDEIAWFMHMLQVAAPNLLPADLTTINDWLKQHSPIHATGHA